MAAINDAPTLTGISDETSDEGETLTFTAAGSDVDGDTLVYSLIGAPTGATLDSSTGVFNWTPAEDQDGAHTFTIRVSDGELFADHPFTVTVNEVNSPPIVEPLNSATSSEGAELVFTALAQDTDFVGGIPNTLTYVWSVTKNGVAYAAGDSAIWSFTPDDNGSYEISLTVSDG